MRPTFYINNLGAQQRMPNVDTYLTRRELKLAAFDKSYFVGTLCKLDEPLSEDKVTEIYDLKKDPKQFNNLRNKKYDEKQVERLLNHIQNRRLEIMKTRH